MQSEKFNKLNKLRKTDYYKNEDEEAFLEKVNYVLQKEEWASYKDVSLKYPNIFVFGLPRSGTTIMSQFLIYAFRLGYINNFMARFWLAPLTGIKLSKKILGENQNTTFTSDYAKTMNLFDIHEFGYFWRYWLKITSINDAI